MPTVEDFIVQNIGSKFGNAIGPGIDPLANSPFPRPVPGRAGTLDPEVAKILANITQPSRPNQGTTLEDFALPPESGLFGRPIGFSPTTFTPGSSSGLTGTAIGTGAAGILATLLDSLSGPGKGKDPNEPDVDQVTGVAGNIQEQIADLVALIDTQQNNEVDGVTEGLSGTGTLVGSAIGSTIGSVAGDVGGTIGSAAGNIGETISNIPGAGPAISSGLGVAIQAITSGINTGTTEGVVNLLSRFAGPLGIFAPAIIAAIGVGRGERHDVAENFKQVLDPVFQRVGLNAIDIGKVGGQGRPADPVQPLTGERSQFSDAINVTLPAIFAGLGHEQNRGGMFGLIINNNLEQMGASAQQTQQLLQGFLGPDINSAVQVISGNVTKGGFSSFLGNTKAGRNAFFDTDTGDINQIVSRLGRALDGLESVYGESVANRDQLLSKAQTDLTALGLENRLGSAVDKLRESFEDDDNRLTSREKEIFKDIGAIRTDADLARLRAAVDKEQERQEDDRAD